MVVGLLVIAAVGLTLFSSQHIMQEKAIKSFDMAKYKPLTPPPPLDRQTPRSVTIEGNPLLRVSWKDVVNEKAKVRREAGELIEEFLVSYDSWRFSLFDLLSRHKISSVIGGSKSFSYGYGERCVLTVTVPKRVTIDSSFR